MEKIGVIGCGLMGAGIIRTLLQAEYPVTVYDVNDQAVENVVTLGAVKASNIKHLAERVDIIILSLPSAELIENVVQVNDDALLKVFGKNKVIIDMSTNDVALTKKLYNASKKEQIYFFDCPLSGGPDGARSGNLTMMVGGDRKKYEEILTTIIVKLPLRTPSG